MLMFKPNTQCTVSTNDDVFENMFSWDPYWARGVNTPYNLESDESNVTVHLEIPGMQKDEIAIAYKDGVLNISGEKKNASKTDDNGYHTNRISYGKFEQSFRVGEVEFEKSKANYENGVLKIELPKAEAAKPQRLSIN